MNESRYTEKQCPECSRWQRSFVRSCECGHEFWLEQTAAPRKRGSVILELCTFLFGLTMCWAVAVGAISLAQGQVLAALILTPIAVILCLGMMIVFTEVDRLIAARREPGPETAGDE